MKCQPLKHAALPSPTQPLGLGLPSPAVRERVPSGARRARVFQLSAAGALLFTLLPLALAGCGRRGLPEAPPDEPNTFPRSYPSE